MVIKTIQPYEELQRIYRAMDAPVYVNRHGKTGKVYFSRRKHFSEEDVLNFFENVTNRERTVNEPLTTNQGQTPFGSFQASSASATR